jgi:hypothetical protein
MHISAFFNNWFYFQCIAQWNQNPEQAINLWGMGSSFHPGDQRLFDIAELSQLCLR